ncbi:MAG: ElyC/SanA/YdcF family protein, partial [Cyanobacteria bacterium J06635_11]
LFSEILLSPNKTRRILLVTDEPHMARSAMVFRSFGFEVVPYPTQANFSLRQILRESAGLVAYSTSGKLRPMEADQVRRAEAEASYKIKDWKCSLPKQK